MKAFVERQTIVHLFCKLPPIFLFHFIILQLLAPIRAHQLGNETDHAALLAIKNQLVDHHSGVLSSWNHSLHHCDWEGVLCGPKHNRVVVLNLSSSGLVGTISPFIGNLSFLKAVGLNNNSLIGPIPPEIGRLFRLQLLLLYSNTLRGEIPANLSTCINLEQLSIGQNMLEGKLPLELRALSKLIFLGVRDNRFTGPFFEVVTNLTSLTVVFMFSNYFTGNIPTSIGKMQNLIILDFGYNQLSGTVPISILNCSMLETLYVVKNKLHGELPPDIGLRLTHLITFDISFNQFSGAFPKSLLNLTSLQSLGLINNSFVGRVPHNFGRLYNLWYLELGLNYLEGDISFVSSLVNCSQLNIVDLRVNEFTGMLPETVANLSTNLQVLELDNNRIIGRIPVGITKLFNLQVLEISGNEFTGSIPLDLGKLQKLERLFLRYNKLIGSIPDTLGNLSFLSVLHLDNNQLEGSIPPSLGGCRSLLNMDLSSNHLNGTLMDELFTGPAKFLSVNLSNNLLEESIPLQISNQFNLVEFFVFQNKLSGIIPYGLSDCVALNTLDIHGNFFYGFIPKSFSSLRSLQFVDFSQNNLSGTIPDYFSKFSLSLLNLSYNNFEGEVPTTGVFANISAIALDGNTKLCGGIPKLHLPRCVQPKEMKKKGKTYCTLKWILSVICALVGVVIIGTLFYLIRHRKKRVPTSSGSTKEAFMKVSYDMLLKATNEFALENLVGAGSFGSVFRGTLDGNTVAVKVLNLQTRGASKSFMAECKALRNVRHRNLVGIITACSSIDFQRNDFKALVYEFMPNGSLDGWLHEDRVEKLSLVQRLDIAIDVAHALNYLHLECEIPIVHCDLKPTNILLDDNMVARVGDFGLSKFLAQPQHPNQSSSIGIRGTVGYTAPEYGLGSEPSPNGDIYSYGIVVLELMTGKSPTHNKFEEDYNLHTYVEAALPDNVLQIIDSSLKHHEITKEVDELWTIKVHKDCMLSVIGVGIACSKHLPQDRMKISDAVNKLLVARDNLCKATYTEP